MAFIPTPQRTARIRVHWTQGAATAQNVFYVNIAGSGPLTQQDCLDATNQVASAYNHGTQFNPLEKLSPQTVLTQIDCEDASHDGAHHATTTWALAGYDSAAKASSPGVAMVVTMLTPFRGRSYRGRLYQIGIDEQDVDPSGAIDGTVLSQLQTYWSDWLGWLADGSTIDLTPVVCSYFHNGAPRSLAQVTDITSVLVRPYVRSQRRRNIGA